MSLDEERDRNQLRAFGGVWLTPGPGRTRPYRPLSTLTAVVRSFCLITFLVAMGVTVATGVALLTSNQLFAPMGSESVALATVAGRLQILMVSLLLLAAGSFAWLVTRAYRNLPSLGAEGLRIGPRFVAAIWFVPFANLVLPKEMIDDLFRASDPDAPVLSAAWRAKTVPVRIHLWWTSVLGGAVLLVAAQWLLPTDPLVSTRSNSVGLSLVLGAHLLIASASLLSAWIVGVVDDRQARRLERLGRVVAGRRVDPDEAVVLDDEPVAVDPTLVHADAGSVWGRY